MTISTGVTAPNAARCPAHRSKFRAGCPDCQALGRRYQNRRRLDAIRGNPRHVDATGTIRRLQGLAALGHPAHVIAANTVLSHRSVQELQGSRQTTVHRDTAASVAAAARRLARTPGASANSRAAARRNGWVPLAAWDDIDDPAATPDYGPEAVQRGPLTLVHVEDVEWLLDAGGTWHSIAARLRVSKSTVDQTLRRHGRLDLIHRLAVASDPRGLAA